MKLPNWLKRFYCWIGWHNVTGYDFSGGIPGIGRCHWCGNMYTLNRDGSFRKLGADQ